MDSDQISVRVDPVGTKIPWPPELEAAVAFLAHDDNVAQMDDPDGTTIELRGTFSRADLIALLSAWTPRLRCANGHRQAKDTERKVCWCFAAIPR